MTASNDASPICVQCGTQYPRPRPDCPICRDERQFVNWNGQQWTTLPDMRAAGYSARIEQEGPDVIGIGTEPNFAIGQRALLIRTGTMNVLWDCVTYLDDGIVDRVTELGGINAIAISHPHYYSTMLEWARAFDAPVYLHEADRQWVPEHDDRVVFWSGDTAELGPGLTLINAGVHFAGGSVLHWNAGSALFSGDILQVVPDRRWVSFMRSYPNLIPERPEIIRRAVARLEPFPFERVYGAWWRRIVDSDGSAAVRRSADRYLRHATEGGSGFVT
ncbi:MBL fold metallo-hydrolase [Parasphingorhabdus pacifica]